MNTVALVSLRFNPAHVQLLFAYAKAFHELGFNVDLLIDAAYRQFPELEAQGLIVRKKNWTERRYSHAVFMNASPGNRGLAEHLKSAQTRILLVYHEPWNRPTRNLFSEGFTSVAKAIIAHQLTVPVLKLADAVLLASRFGLDLYQKRDIRYNRNALYVPLLYDDEAEQAVSLEAPPKRFFAYIGGLGHGFEDFVRTARYALHHQLDIEFLIASRESLPARALDDPVIQSNRGRIDVRAGRILSNQEMNRCYAESFCVWSVYGRSTQSGVLPKAFMFGSPVIASKVGSFLEYVRDGYNGRFATVGKCDEIVAAVMEIKRDLMRYSDNCRKTFLSTFFYKSQIDQLREVLVRGPQ